LEKETWTGIRERDGLTVTSTTQKKTRIGGTKIRVLRRFKSQTERERKVRREGWALLAE